MSKKLLLLIGLFLMTCFSTSFAQSRSLATRQGSWLVTGMFSYSNQGGELYDDSRGNSVSTVWATPGVYYYISPGFGLGAELSWSNTSQGGSSNTLWSRGPKAGYFFDSGNSAIPFLEGGVSYLEMSSNGYDDSGLRLKLGAGLLIRNDHLGFGLEAAYVYDRFRVDTAYGTRTVDGDTFVISAGFAAFLY
ncbi:MAG: porin family protein [Chlorobiales bacterium]|nr:porin family protein [Chlorobiales bacterium]